MVVPIYFVSRVLQGAKLNYPPLEKLILALVHAVRRLRREHNSAKKQIPKDSFLYTDGASSFDCSGAGLMLISPEGKEYTYALRFEFETTNNEAEYEALLEGLQIAQEMEIRSLAIFADSQLMVNQIKGLFEAKKIMIKQYLEKNKKADALISGPLPEDPKEARKIIIRAPQYKLIKGRLYKKSFLAPWLRCIGPSQIDNIIKEIREGSCGFNMEPRSMVIKVMKQVGSTWPFSHLGINILGPLPTAPKNLKFLAIAVEHSTKWVEAKPLTTINERQAKKFTWEHVICRFKVPKTMSSKDDKQYKEGIFSDICKGLKITQSFSPITEHVEIINHIKKQLVGSQQGWADDLARILWVHRTLPRNSQNETPFALTYGLEAIIPSDATLIPESKENTIKAKRKEGEEREVASIEEAY
ncbi:reverse transcriptase domain-containing protein [Tanacetum coccineum]